MSLRCGWWRLTAPRAAPGLSSASLKLAVIDSAFGMYLSHLVPGAVNSDQPTFLTDPLVSATADQGYPGLLLFAVIQNIGRLPVTVQECLWHANDHGKQQLASAFSAIPTGRRSRTG